MKRLIDEKSLLQEFNIEKNNGINPENVTYSSKDKLWWKCKEGHEWQTTYISRSKKQSKCPYCSGRYAIIGVNDLATLYPEVIKEWNYSKNQKLPTEYLSVSGKKVWWKCKEGHEWEAIINTRSKRGYGCPYCAGQRAVFKKNDLVSLRPKLINEWDYEKNRDVNISEVSVFSHLKVWWKCKEGHSYKMIVQKRTKRGYGCPYCSGRRVISGETDLASLYPDIAAQWNYEKNESEPSEYTAKSGARVWWKCKEGHEWCKPIGQQVLYNICPYCSRRLVTEGVNDLFTTHPEFEKIWNYQKNLGSPQNVKFGTHKKMWCICDKGHEWQAMMGNINKGRGCPFCKGKKPIIGENDLVTLYPEIASEWNYDKNDKAPNEFLSQSNRKVWWKCKAGHEWRAVISDRVNYRTTCPYC